MKYDLRRFLSLFSRKMAYFVQVLLAYLATFGELMKFMHFAKVHNRL